MIGKTFAQYEITAPLGKGGMGEVYRARDTKLGRDVAIKVLPKEMSGDPERAARFDREARALASLQHANVASIYGFENFQGVQFLAMELVEGQNLQERLMEGPLPHDELLSIARQMAAGLEAAHDKGIIHRDLKPANVMLTADGDVKILDFGLARAWFGESAEDGDITQSPTITAAMTQAGTILGTAAYMSPEQARGKNVDRRADIWAFGVILWEMLTGRRLFEGETVSDTLAAVIRAEPEWELLPSGENPLLCRLIERCLIRDPRQRLRDIGEARIALESGASDPSLLSALGTPGSSAETPPAASRPALLPLIVIAVLFSALGAGIGWKLLATQPELPLYHVMIPEPENAEFDLGTSSPGSAVLSPDGSMLAFAASIDDGPTLLFLRHLDEGLSVPLSGTDGAAYPFWSPDSRYIGFFSASGDQKLKKVSVTGSSPITLCPAANGKGGTWNEDGTIVFAPNSGGPIQRISSIGGDPVPVTTMGPNETSHRHPRFLPNGRDFLFLSIAPGSSDGLHEICLGSLEGDSLRVLAESQCQAEYSNGHLLTVREDVLMATPFDPGTATLTGGSTPLVEEIFVASAASAAGAWSSTPDGMLSFQTGVTAKRRVLEWQELKTMHTLALPTLGNIYRPRISPDGKLAVIEVVGESQEGGDLWIVDLESGLRTRFTFDAGDEGFAVWAPDGKSVLYVSQLPGTEPKWRVLQQPVDGVGGAAILVESEHELRPTCVTPNGQFLYLGRGVDSNYDILRLPLQAEGELEEVLATENDEGGAMVSPNGLWMAYHATSASTWDIFVTSIDGGRRKWQLTTAGAVWPRWNSDGTELLANMFNGDVVAFAVDTSSETFSIRDSRKVARTESPLAEGAAYSLHPDGTRILTTLPDAQTASQISLIHLVTDWRRGLAR